VKVHPCGLCRTDLHVVDGELSEPKLPLIPGHQVVGEVVAVGARVDEPQVGGDIAGQAFAMQIGATWAGDTTQPIPEELDAAIIFAPAGELLPLALGAVAKGGRVVCAGIHMSDIPSFPYRLLWGERTACSVANLTRRDGVEFLALAPQIPVRTTVKTHPLEEANQALTQLRDGRVQGVLVLSID
jgi:alcohol dehydrogenase, propanol-preferring